jgi:hypothetical protein
MTKVGTLGMVSVVVVLGAVTVVLAGGRLPWSDYSPSQCDIPESITGVDASPSTAAPGGGGVRVVDQGFTQAEEGSVSLGAVMENASSSVAYRTRITFRLFDATHTPMSEAGTVPSRLVVEIPVILPGQRIGAGNGARPGRSQKVASFEVELGTTTWLPREALGKDFSPVIAAYLRTDRPDPRFPTSVDMHYKETSTNCRSLVDRQAAAVFRDAQGKIVGGTLDSPGGLIIFRDDNGKDLGGEQKPPSSPSCTQGERETWIVPLILAPTAAADSHTEIYPYCDLSSSPYSDKPNEPRN